MATNQDAIHQLIASKATFEAQVDAGAAGENLTNLMDAISAIEAEVGQLVLQALAASYVPQTDAFKAATADAQGFVTTLNKIKTALGVLGQVASAVAGVLKFVM